MYRIGVFHEYFHILSVNNFMNLTPNIKIALGLIEKNHIFSNRLVKKALSDWTRWEKGVFVEASLGNSFLGIL